MGIRRMLTAQGLENIQETQEPQVEQTAPRRTVLRAIFGVATRWQTYARLLYVLLSFPLGVAVFVALVTLIATGGGLAITLAGIPLLILTMFGWCYAAEVHRLLANALLRTDIRPLPFDRESGKVWQWSRIKARIGNQYTWRALVFGFVSFATGIAGLAIAWSTLGQSIALIHMPITYWIGEGPELGPGWHIDTLREALLCTVAGVLLIVPSLHVINLTGIVAGKIVTFFLQSGGSASPAGATPEFDRAVMAAIAWQGYGTKPLDEHGERVRFVQLRVWQAHLALYALTMVVLVFINGATTPGNWWVLWPAWSWGMAIALHTGYLLWGHLGAHAATYAVTTVGLFVIDSMFTGRSWFFWPAIGWGIAVAAHAYVFFGFSKVRPEEALVTIDGPDAAPMDPPSFEPIAVDVEMRNVLVDGEAIDVTPREFDLLALLTAHPGKPFSREELLDRIWKNDFEVTDRTIDTHVQRLRRKLGLRSDAIQTVWGVGYRYQP